MADPDEVIALRQRLGIDRDFRREHNRSGAERRIQARLEREGATGNGTAPTAPATATATRPTAPPATAPPSTTAATPPPAPGGPQTGSENQDPTGSPTTPAEPVQTPPDAAFAAERAAWATEKSAWVAEKASLAARAERADQLEKLIIETGAKAAVVNARALAPDVILRMLDRSKLGLNAAGEVCGLEQAIGALMKELPQLFGRPSTGSGGGRTGGGSSSHRGSTASRMDEAIRRRLR